MSSRSSRWLGGRGAGKEMEDMYVCMYVCISSRAIRPIHTLIPCMHTYIHTKDDAESPC